MSLKSQNANFFILNFGNPISRALVARFLVKRANEHSDPVLTRNDLKFEIPSQIIV